MLRFLFPQPPPSSQRIKKDKEKQKLSHAILCAPAVPAENFGCFWNFFAEQTSGRDSHSPLFVCAAIERETLKKRERRALYSWGMKMRAKKRKSCFALVYDNKKKIATFARRPRWQWTCTCPTTARWPSKCATRRGRCPRACTRGRRRPGDISSPDRSQWI